jgi:hypothetical protein
MQAGQFREADAAAGHGCRMIFLFPTSATCKELVSMVFHSALILLLPIQEHPDISLKDF